MELETNLIRIMDEIKKIILISLENIENLLFMNQKKE